MHTWDDLRFFLELSRCGSLSETARRLKADHATVSRRITALETRLGLKLFTRLPRGYLLTPEGHDLADRATAVETAMLAVERLARGSTDTLDGTVRISAPPVFASHWLTPRLLPLRQAHPALCLEVVGESGFANLNRGEADLALRLSRPEDNGLIARSLGQMRFGLYGATVYVAATAENDHVFLGYHGELAGSPQQVWLDSVRGRRQTGLRTNDLATLIAGVRSGMGLAALPHMIAQDIPGLTCLCDAPAATRELWLVVHPDLRQAARVRAVADHLTRITAPLRFPTED
ncbi:LysR family transcriptional regulator [Novispirillum itersonii]|uniref:DNA-binding transcriptional LysR family regulator n=1 Tax=Novispirillum itersonii TaxID=189 RepID=A0A7W9ZIX0_NOVIT|nr:LysR family transcriptional regulator [Novispirillum itersonii]MBB6212030.1 DNA-binding transcriptional LysR family regulator [Novispirillum itersonii]